MKKIFILKVSLLVLILMPWLSTESVSGQPKTLFLKKNKPMPDEAFWIKNHWQKPSLGLQIPPNNWRSTSYKPQAEINSEGFASLLLSGSGALSLGNMLWLKNMHGKNQPIYMVDLRQETHLILNGLPISIFYKRDEINWGKSVKHIIQQELYWAEHLRKANLMSINKLGKPYLGFKIPVEPETITIRDVFTEHQAAQKAGLYYFRLNVPDYHPPAPQQVDEFLAIIKKMPSGSWLHLHCAAGKGRTTTFMVMRDIVANAHKVSLADILNRQERIGGINLYRKSASLSGQPWKAEYHQARSNFITLFYAFVHSKAHLKQSFKDWIVKQPMGPYKHILKSAAYELQTRG